MNPATRFTEVEAMECPCFDKLNWDVVNENGHGPGGYQGRFRDETDCGCFDWTDMVTLDEPARELLPAEEAVFHDLPLFVSKEREHKDHKARRRPSSRPASQFPQLDPTLGGCRYIGCVGA